MLEDFRAFDAVYIKNSEEYTSNIVRANYLSQ